MFKSNIIGDRFVRRNEKIGLELIFMSFIVFGPIIYLIWWSPFAIVIKIVLTIWPTIGWYIGIIYFPFVRSPRKINTIVEQIIIGEDSIKFVTFSYHKKMPKIYLAEIELSLPTKGIHIIKEDSVEVYKFLKGYSFNSQGKKYYLIGEFFDDFSSLKANLGINT